MATAVNSDFVIYNDQAQAGYLERIQDNIDVFNAASNGAIVFVNEGVLGNFEKKAFFKKTGGITYRNVESTENVTPSKITQDENVGVKCPYKYGPFETTKEAFKRTGQSPEVFSYLMGQDAADSVTEGSVHYALNAVKAAIESNSSMVITGSLGDKGALIINDGLATFGDKANRIVLLVMNSVDYRALVGNALTEKVYDEVGAVIYGGTPGTLGKPVLVTDLAAVGTVYGLQSGAVTIKESQAPEFISYPINDKENLGLGYRGEGTFNVSVLGYKWDVTVGKENPDLGKIGDKANWAKTAESNKATAGFIINAATEGTKTTKKAKADKVKESGGDGAGNGDDASGAGDTE